MAIAQVRLMVLALLFAVGMVFIIGRLAVLAIMAEPARAAVQLTGLGARGDITDRNGQPLARTVDGWSLAIHPDRVIGDRSALAKQLAQLIPEKTEAQYFVLLNTGSKFAWLKRRAGPELVKAVNALGEPAIEPMREPDRLYPQSTMAAHVLGYVRSDGTGGWGMEGALNQRLQGEGARAAPVALSIDMRVQGALENELARSMVSFQAKGAAGVILDVETGEVVAMASLPTFNPNAIAGPIPRNNMTQSRYELGSTFKPIAVAAAIEAGTIKSMAKRYDATEPIKIGRFTINDDHPLGRFITVPEVLIHSSNIATARIADEMGREPLERMFRAMHFDRKLSLEVENEGPLWPGDWGRTTTMTAAYGHGISVTPLHLACAYAALVNGGLWRPATLLRIEPGKAPAGERVISAETSLRIRELLRLIVTEGTGSKANAAGYRVGGKTGTAEKLGGGGYLKNQNVSTFAAAFPMDAPRYVVIAMLDSPIGNAESAGQRTAGWTAAPLVGRLVTRVGPMMGVIPDPNRDIALGAYGNLVAQEDKEKASDR
ncbi:peptidoglycan D,D-transpeptidase FtsI family protein [Sphingomonas canadensis]|uniref:Peptidoglycan D,D-transpeptidase FtsI family protein n=1 Tax=Sphingomonas canadensis TaxID=1219257 RepID=A0ABW3H8F2_9SPHN|nr:penicillin-binding protein 2 [Sphingomonas canadensis]